MDTALQEAAAERAATLLAELGGAHVVPGRTVVGAVTSPTGDDRRRRRSAPLVGIPFSDDEVVRHLTSVGCTVDARRDALLTVTAPSWRPDLSGPADLVEEVARLHGYQHIPSELPPAPVSSGLTHQQRLRRRVGLALAGAGYVEVQTYPFLAPRCTTQMGLPADDARRRALRLANPLSEEEPELRTTLLPGLFGVARRNVGRGTDNLALFETGLVFRPDAAGQGGPPAASRRRPSSERRRAGGGRGPAPAAAAPRRGGAHRRARALRLVGRRARRHLG